MGSEILNNRNSLSMPSSHSCSACPILFRLICGNYDQLPTEVSGLCNDSNSLPRRLCYLCCHLRTLCALVAKAARMLHRVVFGTNNSQPHNLRAHDTSNVPYIWSCAYFIYVEIIHKHRLLHCKIMLAPIYLNRLFRSKAKRN